MEATSTLELAKNTGTGFGKKVNELLSRMVVLDGRDKSELEKLGRRVGDQ